MTRNDVRVFLAEELRQVARACVIAITVDRDPDHPAVRFMRKHGGLEAAESVPRDEIGTERGRERALRFHLELTEKLVDEIERVLPPDQRSLVAIKDQLGMPRL